MGMCFFWKFQYANYLVFLLEMALLLFFGPARPVGTILRPGPARSNKIILGPFGPVSINHFKTIAFKIFFSKKPSVVVRSVARILVRREGNIQQKITQSQSKKFLNKLY